MGLSGFDGRVHHSSSDRPPITCPHFSAVPGTRRCREYLPNGSCQRPDQFMCLEWLKVNAPSVRPPVGAAQPVQQTLFGPPASAPPPPSACPMPSARPAPSPRPPAPAPTDLLRALTEADLASFKARGIEVCVAAADVGDIWIVPAYTGQSRRELSLEHAALLAAIGAVFPGARVKELRETAGADRKVPSP